MTVNGVFAKDIGLSMAGAIFGNGGNIGTGSVTVIGMLRICVASLRVIPGWILPDETPSLNVSSGSIVNS